MIQEAMIPRSRKEQMRVVKVTLSRVECPSLSRGFVLGLGSHANTHLVNTH